MNRSLTIGLVAFLFLGAFSFQLISNSGGPPLGRTGAPGESTCNAAGCHNSFALNSGSGTPSITTSIPQDGYTPGETYTLTFKIEENGIGKFGFEGMVYSPATMNSTGSFAITDADNTQLRSTSNREYVSHTFAGTAATDSQTWSVDWTAPEAGSGQVEIYAAFNAANNANGNQGDNIYTDDLAVAENTTTSVENGELEQNLRWFVQGGMLNLSLDLKRPGDVSWNLTDLQGRQVIEEFAYSTSNSYSTSVSTDAMTSGVYVLTVKAPGKLLSQKIIVR